MRERKNERIQFNSRIVVMVGDGDSRVLTLGAYEVLRYAKLGIRRRVWGRRNQP